MIDRFRHQLKQFHAAHAAQGQREAAIDLLVWTMYADAALTLPEQDHIDTAVEALTVPNLPMQQYLRASVAKVRDALRDQNQADVLLKAIKDRLETDTVRRRAYEAALDLARSDGEVADEEARLLSRVRDAFGITGDEPPQNEA